MLRRCGLGEAWAAPLFALTLQIGRSALLGARSARTLWSCDGPSVLDDSGRQRILRYGQDVKGSRPLPWLR
jgi:hypothetical protein